MNVFEIWNARQLGMPMGKPDGEAPVYMLFGDEFTCVIDLIAKVDPADIRLVEAAGDEEDESPVDRYELDVPASISVNWPEGVSVTVGTVIVTDGKTQLRHDFPRPVTVSAANPLVIDGPLTFPISWRD